MSHRSPEQSRRELFAGWLRYATLGVVVAAGGLTAAKRRRLINKGICIHDGACRGCTVLAECDLPRASYAKTLIEKGSDGPAK